MAHKTTSRDQRDQLITRARHMRNHPTLAEAVLWEKLRARQLHDHKFRRQHIIPPFIVDFYCAEKRLIVEVDGTAHDHVRGYDQEREQHLLQQGYIIIRFSNEQILEDLDHVLSVIDIFLQ
jgi:leucyl-tRNA synthetase